MVERCPSARDRAIALLLFYTSLRISECAALTLDGVRLSARKGIVIIRMGKGNTYREVPLNAEVRAALDTWLKQRKKLVSHQDELAFFLTKRGTRLAVRTIDDILCRRMDRAKTYRHIEPLLKGTINQELILDSWDGLIRVAGLLKRGWVTSSLFISRLQARPRQNALARALQEYGRYCQLTNEWTGRGRK